MPYLTVLAVLAPPSVAPAPLDAEPRLLEPLAPSAVEPTFAAAGGGGTSVGIYYADLELAEIDVEGPGGTATLRDAPRERLGAQIGFGDVFLRVYSEETDSDELDGFGIGLGLRAARPLGDLAGDVQALVEYEIALDASFLSEDVFDSDLFLLDLTGKLGPGIGVDMFVASAGVAASFLWGEWDIPAQPSLDLDGMNVGFYVSAGLRPGQLPLKASVDAHFGDVEGIAATVGFAF